MQRPPNQRPLVRPPRFAQGGGVASAFGNNSGAPAVPVPGTRRGRMLAIQYADDERGRFTERVFPFPQFPGLAPGGFPVAGAQSSQQIEVTSNRTSFVRLVALRGLLQNSDNSLTGFELANLFLRLQINGEEDLTTGGNQAGPASFDMLFATPTAPWFWMACPPRLRVGDTLQCTVVNTIPVGEGAPTLTPQVALRLVDDEWWRALYGGDYDDVPDDNYGPQG